MAIEWREYTIGEIADIIGGSTPSTSDPDNFNGDIPWLTPKDLSGPHDRYISRGERNLSRKGLASCSAQLLPSGAVLLSSRAPVGYVAIAKNPVATNQGFRSLVLKPGFEPEFVYYWLKANVDELERHASGSTFKELSGLALAQITIRLPDHRTQRAIAHILGTLDDKIELNRRMNATLEAIARAIFKSWFVDFDPVHAKARGEQPPGMDAETAALFPDSFENSELGQIPAGWGVGALSNIADNPRRGIKPEAMDSNTLYIGLEHMPQKSITLDAWGRTSNVASNKFKFRKGEFLFGKLRPYFHKVGIAPDDGVCSTDILVIVPTFEAWYGLTLFHISSKEFIDYTTAASTGTRMPRTNWDTMSKYPIVIPDPKVAEAFSCFLRPLLDTIQNNIWQSRTLAALRDALLPKLISGELRTKELHHVPSTGTG